mgnify:CR=1 FL=1
MKYIIYHNKMCSKSRSALNFMIDRNMQLEVVEYLKNKLTKDDLKSIIKKLNVNPIDIVRVKDICWKENYKKRYDEGNIANSKLIDILIKHPRLIERPIVLCGDKGVIARPLEKINFLV